MENWESIIFLLASGQGLVLSLALLSPAKNKNKANIFLGLILWVLSLELLSAWGMKVDYFASANAIPYYLLGSYLILPPSIWLYSQMNINSAFKLSKKHLLLFAPAIIETIVEVAMHLYFRYTGDFIRMLDYSLWYFLTELMPIGGIVLALWIFCKKLVPLSNQAKEPLSFQSYLLYINLWSFFAFLCLLTVLWIAGVIIDLPVFGTIELILTVFLFTLGYIGYFKPTIFEVQKISLPIAADVNTFPNFDDEKELARVKRVLKEEALYTRSKLSLEELADKLRLPTRYLSYLINTYHATNFNNFINSYRVEEVIRKIQDPAEQHKTLLALALEAGFSSKSTFNHVFKKHTGHSPSKYLLSHE